MACELMKRSCFLIRFRIPLTTAAMRWKCGEEFIYLECRKNDGISNCVRCLFTLRWGQGFVQAEANEEIVTQAYLTEAPFSMAHEVELNNPLNFPTAFLRYRCSYFNFEFKDV